MPAVPLSELVTGARSGEHLISFPTDTVPALAARPDRSALIFEAKQRSQDKPLILMAAEATDLWEYVQGSESELEIWQQAAKQYWPGALTLVLPASNKLPKAMNPSDPTTIGIRVPDSAIARYILALTTPLATTSVNRSGQPPLTTLDAINAEFPQVLTLQSNELVALDRSLNLDRSTQSQSQAGVPSTVAKWTGKGWQILRQGSVVLPQLA